MATVPTVADNALILTDWGNVVAAEVNDSVKKHLPQVMAAGSSLTAPTLMISTNQNTTAPSSSHAIRLDYANAHYLQSDGGTVSGLVTISPTGTSDNCLRLNSAAPFLEWWNEAGSARFGYIRASAASMLVANHGPSTGFTVDDVTILTLQNLHALVGMAAPSNYADQGVDMSIAGQIYTTISGTGQRNLNCGHIAAADAAGSQFIRFSRTTSGTSIGAITQVGTSGTNYGESSDRRMKTIIGPVPDPVERVRALTPYRVSWNDDAQRDNSDAFIADEVAEVVPGAVVGEPDAVDADGDPDYQMLDYSKVVPLLTAALQTALDKIDALETRVAELETV